MHEYDDVCSTPEREWREEEGSRREGERRERSNGMKYSNINFNIFPSFFFLIYSFLLYFSFFPSFIVVASTIATSCEQINRIFSESEDQGPRASGCKRLRGRSSIPFMPLPTLLHLPLPSLLFFSLGCISPLLRSETKDCALIRGATMDAYSILPYPSLTFTISSFLLPSPLFNRSPGQSKTTLW